MAATETPPELDPGSVTAPPEPFLQGTFALFLTPDGAAVLAYRTKGSSEDKQMMIPSFILETAANASGMSRAEIFAKIKSGDV